MKRKRFNREQIIGVLKESEAGAKTDDICGRHGISSATFYSWRKTFGGMDDETLSAIVPSDNGACGSDAGHVRHEGPAPKILVSPWRSDEPWAF
jgi:putative transposase